MHPRPCGIYKNMLGASDVAGLENLRLKRYQLSSYPLILYSLWMCHFIHGHLGSQNDAYA